MAAVYTRVSTLEQRAGWSLGGQYAELRNYCERMGYRVRWRFSDVESGSTLERPGLQRLLGLADGQRFQVIVVWRRDRFGRDPVHNSILERALHGVGVRVEAMNRGPQPDDFDTEFYNGLDDLVNRRESRLTARRLQFGRRTATVAGCWSAGEAPYGYRRNSDTGRLDPFEAEAAQVRDVFRQVAAGESARSVAARHGWRHPRVVDTLHNPAYVGDLAYDGILHRNAHQALVTRDLQAAALAALAQHRGGRRALRVRRKPIQQVID